MTASVRAREQLDAIARELGLALDDAAHEKLAALRALWLRYARAMNLVGAHDEASLWPHLGDGLATVACAQRAEVLGPDTTWLDVGSGGGFPALVVAAVTPCRMVLVEPRHKRAAFLELALRTIVNEGRVHRCAAMDATWEDNAEISGNYAENMRPRIASSRATFVPARWLELGDKLVMEGGVLLAHVRPQDDLDGWPVPIAQADWGRSRVLAIRTGPRGTPAGSPLA